MAFPGDATVIVAHGAWADGSSWNEVILTLESRGLEATL
jgi:hypothetical protein